MWFFFGFLVSCISYPNQTVLLYTLFKCILFQMGFGALIGASYILFGEYVVKGNNWKHFLVIYIKLIQTCGMYFF